MQFLQYLRCTRDNFMSDDSPHVRVKKQVSYVEVMFKILDKVSTEIKFWCLHLHLIVVSIYEKKNILWELLKFWNQKYNRYCIMMLRFHHYIS